MAGRRAGDGSFRREELKKSKRGFFQESNGGRGLSGREGPPVFGRLFLVKRVETGRKQKTSHGSMNKTNREKAAPTPKILKVRSHAEEAAVLICSSEQMQSCDKRPRLNTA